MILLLIPSLINISALYRGLVYRVRYSVLLLPAVAVFISPIVASSEAKKRVFLFLVIVAMALPWLSWCFNLAGHGDQFVPGPGAFVLPVVGLLLFMIARIRQWYGWGLLALCILGMQLPPLAREYHPMMKETLEHKFIESERQEVLQYLRQNYDGLKILIDMGKQAPLVYDSGLAVKEFVYNEGGEVLWHEANRNPEQYVGWLCMAKGDAVWAHLQAAPDLFGAYAPVLKTDFFSLYRLKY